jgi:CRP-like cAMP-binding protein
VIKHVLEEIEILRLGEGGVILKRGDKSDKVFVILEGSVDVLVHIDIETGNHSRFDTLNTGSCFCAF